MSAEKLKIKTTSLPKSRIAVSLEIPAAKCESSYEEAISRLSKSVKLPGFRKGKVPRAVILQRLGIQQIKATALERLIEGVWKEAINTEAIEPLCEPEVQGGIESIFEKFEPSKSLEITFETDIYPSPKLKKTKGLEVEAESIIFDPKRVDELIEQSRKQLATLVPIENRAAQLGDIAVMSFKGKYVDDGSDIEGGSSESMDIDLEEGKMIPGFIEGIIGMVLNEEKNLKCKFPDDYPQKDSQGREASFHVKLEDLKTRELPELNDDFAQQASDKSNMKDLRLELEEKLKEDAKRRNNSNRHEALLNSLSKELEVELPKTLIDQEVRNIIEQTARKFADQGMDVKSLFTQDLVQSLMESSRGEAEENLKRSMALKVLAEEEKIEVKDKDIEAKTKELNEELSKNQKIDQNRLKEAVKEDLLQNKILEWLEENNTVIETVSETDKKPSKGSPKAKATGKAKGKE